MDNHPETQYQDLLHYVLTNGVERKATNQGVSAISCFRPPVQLRYDLSECCPLITERKISFWHKAIGEIFAFVNGAVTTKELEEFGCNWWDTWTTKECGESVGLKEGELGPGSYGAAFHHFATPGLPDGFNQFKVLVKGLKERPWSRTNLVSPWVPYYASEYGDRKVFCAPCHGWINCYVHDGRLHLAMDQRSADLVIGVPSNLIQYSALLIALSHVTGLQPGTYIHTFVDLHIYVDQLGAITEMLRREPRPLPKLSLSEEGKKLDNLFDFRPEHFEIRDYKPHPAITNIPVAL